MSHTLGPWKSYGPVVTANEMRIAQTHFGDNCEADARLIAAAPDLLDRCQRLMPLLNNCKGYVDVVDEAIDLMRSAINKATQGKQ